MLSRVVYTGSTASTFSYAAVPLLDDLLVTEQSQLVVKKNGVALTYKSAAPGATEYTLNKTTRVMTLGAALIVTDTLRIVRDTKTDAMHVVFTNNAPMGAEDINLCLKQVLFLNQEREDDLSEL